MKRPPTPSDTLRDCFEFAEGKYDITLNQQTEGPEAAMYTMSAARTMAQKPHDTFKP